MRPAKVSRNPMEPTCVAWNALGRLLTEGKAAPCNHERTGYVPASSKRLRPL